MAQPETEKANPDAIREAAAVLGLDVPEACHEGIAANLRLLKTHFAVVAAAIAEKDPVT